MSAALTEIFQGFKISSALSHTNARIYRIYAHTQRSSTISSGVNNCNSAIVNNTHNNAAMRNDDDDRVKKNTNYTKNIK